MKQASTTLVCLSLLALLVSACSPAPPDRAFLDREFAATHPSWNIVDVSVGEAPSGPSKYFVHFHFTTEISDEVNKVVWTVERSDSGFDITKRGQPLLPID